MVVHGTMGWTRRCEHRRGVARRTPAHANLTVSRAVPFPFSLFSRMGPCKKVNSDVTIAEHNTNFDAVDAKQYQIYRCHQRYRNDQELSRWSRHLPFIVPLYFPIYPRFTRCPRGRAEQCAQRTSSRRCHSKVWNCWQGLVHPIVHHFVVTLRQQ